MIDKTAIIDPKAKISSNVKIGPYSIIGPHVEIDDDVVIQSHVIITGHTIIGKNNNIYPMASIGSDPQDLKYKGEKTTLMIGANNTIREHVTINTGTVQGGGNEAHERHCSGTEHVIYSPASGMRVLSAGTATTR